MRVKIEVEFEVTTKEEDMTEQDAKCVAEMAALHNLVFTDNGQDIARKPVKHHVDGFGVCMVSIPES